MPGSVTPQLQGVLDWLEFSPAYHSSHGGLTSYGNGMGFRAIERSTSVNHNTVINWVKQVGNSLPDAPEESEIPDTQVDELWC